MKTLISDMKTSLPLLSTYFAGFVFPQTLVADSSLDIFPEDIFENPHFVTWDDDSIWSNGVPTEDCSVDLFSVTDDFGEPIDVFLELFEPVTIQNLTMEFGVDINTAGQNLFVTDSTSGSGFITIDAGSTVSLGDLEGFDQETKTLNTDINFLLSGRNPPNLAILEFRGADIEVNDSLFNLFGPNFMIRDQDTGLNAFRNFKRNTGSLTLDFGVKINTTGDFTNDGTITMALNESELVPEVNIGGNFINNGRVSMRGNTVLNVAGSYSGSGSIGVSGDNNQISAVGAFELDAVQTEVIPEAVVTIDSSVINRGDLIASGYGGECIITGDFTQSGGTVNTGPFGPDPNDATDSFILRAMSQFYDEGASVTGNGRLSVTESIVAENGRIFPGASPGKLTFEGGFVLGAASTIGIEIAGPLPIVEHDVLAQSGSDKGTTVEGTLELTLLDGAVAKLSSTDSLAVLTSDMPIKGTFVNIASGTRLTTTDGGGSFLVTYGEGSSSPNQVTLSDFQSETMITPISYEDWADKNNLPEDRRAPGDDANENGVINLLEYLGGSESGIAHSIDTRESGGETLLVLTLEISKQANSDYLLTSQFSPDLTEESWSDGPILSEAGESSTHRLMEAILQIEASSNFLRYQISPKD